MLLFLDIDGVMIPAKGWKSPELLPDGFPAFSCKAVSALQKIISDQITVVLTTSHKSRFNNQEWKDIFRSRGIHINNLQALPDNFRNLNRKDEILSWFQSHPVDERFVIIDDDKGLNDLPDLFKRNLVQTSPYIGLTEEHADIIKQLLQFDLYSVL